MAYTVFIDESFWNFMNFAKEEGNFCYGALMVPTDRLDDLGRFWAANRTKLATAHSQVTGTKSDGEFKSSHLSQLDSATRNSFARRLGRFLWSNECFVGGFYTTVRNTLLYQLRTDFAKDGSTLELPRDWPTMLPAVKANLLAGKQNHPGEGHALVGMFYQTLVNLLNWLASQGRCFSVVYDPRGDIEDHYLITRTGEWLQQVSEAEGWSGCYLGTSAEVDSSKSVGLMLVDLIVRDIRYLFLDVPELLTDHTAPNLILPAIGEHMPVLDDNGKKWGERRPWSEALRRRLAAPTNKSTVPIYARSLAGGKLSCEASFGESRIINFAQMAFEDMVDWRPEYEWK